MIAGLSGRTAASSAQQQIIAIYWIVDQILIRVTFIWD
jgi:hypothetical protein